jgi:Protein of unknown function (DUF2723)
VSHAKVAVSIHRAPDGPGTARVASRTWIPYSDNAVAFAAAAVALVALAVYLRTMLPSTFFWDTGEAQTVPATLSIFHPTGFPVYVLIGWLWSQLPIGEVAWRMNLLSGLCVAAAAGLVVLIAGHLMEESNRFLRVGAAGVAGLTFAFAAEPWENATRADVHALNVVFVALVVWLLISWAAAYRSGSARVDRWLVAAALAFGLGIGAHPLVGLTAFGVAAWLLFIHARLWRRWRLVAVCAGMVAIGIVSYAYVFLRAIIDPEPALFYAHPDTWERFRYLVLAEQFRDLFTDFGSPLADFWTKWDVTERVLSAQLPLVGWLLVAGGAAILAVRRLEAFVFLGLIVVATVLYAMNFRDGDIDRYYLPTMAVTAPMIGVALALVASTLARAVAEASRRFDASRRTRRWMATAAAVTVVALGALLPATALVSGYESHDQSENRAADEWVASVYEHLPPNAVIVSWWSYSTPLWYHRWVLGERPDVTIIDERNILDDGYRTMHNAIEAHLGRRPVFVVPPVWEYDQLIRDWQTTSIATYPGYSEILHIEALRQ